MEIPDKLYLDDGREYEYIRKEVVDETIETAEDHAYFAGREKMREELLEWVNEALKQSQELKSQGYGDVYYGAHIALLEEVIDHIKQM